MSSDLFFSLIGSIIFLFFYTYHHRSIKMIDFLRFFTVSIILLGFVLKLSFNGS